MYVQDYDETFPTYDSNGPISVKDSPPPGGCWPGFAEGDGCWWSWHQLGYPYTKNFQIYKDPGGPDPSAPIYRGNYGGNSNILRCPPNECGSGSPPPTTLAAIGKPTERIVALEAGGYVVNEDTVHYPCGNFWYIPGTVRQDYDLNTSPDCPWGHYAFYQPLWNDTKNGRYNNGVNIGWADGHAKWMKSSRLVEAKAEPWCLGDVVRDDSGAPTWSCQ